MCKILRGAALDSKLKKMKTRFQLESETFQSYWLHTYKTVKASGLWSNQTAQKISDEITAAVDAGFLHPSIVRTLVHVNVM